MKIGDLVEGPHNARGIITAIELLYPRHAQSPIGRVKVEWLDKAPHWWRRETAYSVGAIKRVVSRA